LHCLCLWQCFTPHFVPQVNGQFKCLGSTQHLKSKFGKGFVMNVKIKRKETELNLNGNNNNINEPVRSDSDEMIEERNAVKDFVKAEFLGAELK
jgi:hypothetical protein